MAGAIDSMVLAGSEPRLYIAREHNMPIPTPAPRIRQINEMRTGSGLDRMSALPSGIAGTLATNETKRQPSGWSGIMSNLLGSTTGLGDKGGVSIPTPDFAGIMRR